MRTQANIADGKGTTGGCSTAKVPDSVVPLGNPPAHTAFADGKWLEGAVAMFATRAAFAGDEAPLTAFAAMDGDSPTLGEALKGPDGNKWRKVTAVEIHKLEEHRTWEYVDHPCDANILPCSFVLCRKHDEHNNVKSYKA
jgi:hypothetical protein